MLGLRIDRSGVLVVVGLGVLSLQGSVRAQIAAHEEVGRGSGVVRSDGAIEAVTTPEVAATVVLEQAATCQPSWLPTFGEAPGVDGNIGALTVFDDGGGPALYVGGYFFFAGGVAVNHIAKWDGTAWSALGSGMNNGVHALTVFDDGSGPALYAAGDFTTAGGVTAYRIAKWDGTSWSAFGGSDWPVVALTVFDDGSGPALYRAVIIFGAGFVSKWNGTSWSDLGSAINGNISALTVFDDGTGPSLYAGGYFDTAGGVPAKGIAKWDGTSWSALGSGLTLAADIGSVAALAAFDDGSGPALYAGGVFDSAGGVSALFIAKWSGSSWAALGSNVNAAVAALAVLDDGSGPALYAGGDFTTAGGVAANHVAKWNGTSWSALGSGLALGFGAPSAHAFAAFDDGSGPVLFAGGYFTTAGGVVANSIAKWGGTTWSPLGSGLDGGVQGLTVFDDGTGPALYAGGRFTAAGGVAANHIAKWDGSSWSVLGSGMNDWVFALTVFDDGSSPALYAGGYFTTAGGVAANLIAKWSGTTWSALGSGMNGSVDALTIFDDGSGPALCAGGQFTVAGGIVAKYIAKWNGASWSALGSGMNGPVEALTVFDDGSGPALYAGGSFTTAGGVAAKRIAKWSGTNWSALGSGVNNSVRALTVFGDGSGPALYAGGDFTATGVMVAKGIAKWDGTSWSALGSGMGGGSQAVYALTVSDDGSGPACYAGGWFTTAGGAAANYIAKWNGSSWSALGSGLAGSGGPSVHALTIFDDSSGPALYAGGLFIASPAEDSYLAKWGGCSPPPSPWTNLGSGLAGISGNPQLIGTGDLVAGTPGKLRLIHAAPSAPAALFISASNMPTPFKGGILLTVPVLLTLPLVTDSMGDILLPWAAWPSGLSGVSLYFQYAIQDSAAVKGVALSNALGADVP